MAATSTLIAMVFLAFFNKKQHLVSATFKGYSTNFSIAKIAVTNLNNFDFACDVEIQTIVAHQWVDFSRTRFNSMSIILNSYEDCMLDVPCNVGNGTWRMLMQARVISSRPDSWLKSKFGKVLAFIRVSRAETVEVRAPSTVNLESGPQYELPPGSFTNHGQPPPQNRTKKNSAF